jgi:RNA polymerase sigma-70 factor (ECF subfamily)
MFDPLLTAQSPFPPSPLLFKDIWEESRASGWNFLFRGVSHRLRGVQALFSAPSAEAPARELEKAGEQSLVKEAMSGEPGFEKLVRTYEKTVYRVAFRFLNNSADASDVAQEVFFRIFRALPDFRGESSLSTWIYSITANLSRNAIRSRKNREKNVILAPGDKPEDNGPSFMEGAQDQRETGSLVKTENMELHEAIQEALQKLPPDYREAVILRDLEDLDYQAIALLLNVELGTVKSRIARGRTLLRQKLKDWL